MAKFTGPERMSAPGRAGVSYALGQMIHNQPLAMQDDAASWLHHQISERAFDLPLVQPDASKFFGSHDRQNGVRITDDGIALVSVAGLLLDRGAFLGDLWGWITTYEGLAEQARRLAKDQAVKAVVLDISSGGGMVAGLWDLCDELRKLRAKKRVYSLAQNMAASAAYAIGLCGHELHVTRSGQVGSVGVVMVHTSYARMLDASGVDVTLLTAGEHKADGNPYQQLGHSARAELGAGIDLAYGEFVDFVASRRKGLDADAVRATEARVYTGQQAVGAKLADKVSSIDELLAHVRAEMKAGGPRSGVKTKTQTQTRPAATPGKTSAAAERPAGSGGAGAAAGEQTMEDDLVTLSQAPDAGAQNGDQGGDQGGQQAAQAVAANAAKPAGQQAASAAATVAAQAAADPDQVERARIKAIVTSVEGQAAPALASHLAFDTAMSAEAAVKALVAAAADVTGGAKASAAAGGEQDAQGALDGALEREMAKSGNSAGVRPEGEIVAKTANPLAEKAKAYKG